MEVQLALAAAAMLAVAGAATLGPRLRIPAPLILVVVGIVVSLLPAVSTVEIEPDVVLLGVLPPLLYAASVALPTMDLRRELGAVSGLSVLLVVITTLVLGWVLTLAIPGLDYVWGVALAAVISPTDAVATSIVKGTRVSHQVGAILEGESLLNDASALVLLRAAIAAGVAGSALSAPGIVGGFALSVVVAVVVGMLVGHASLWLRERVPDPAVGTVLSFTVPFAASIPAEVLGGSGLVAAVAAGLAVGRHAPRRLSPQQRTSDEQNWRTLSLVLEGAVFLLMGLEIQAILDDAGDATLGRAVALGALALVVTLALRAAFVVPLLAALQRRATRGADMRGRLVEMQQDLADAGPDTANPFGRGRPRPMRPRERDRVTRRLAQVLNDIDYLSATTLGPKESAVVVWAGMRGAVTVAAAQTLPEDAADGQRGLLVLVAFATAALSLLVQGGTLTLLIAALKPAGDDQAALRAERERLFEMLQRVAGGVPVVEGETHRARELREARAQRDALLEAREIGVFDSQTLTSALAAIDAVEVALEMHGDPPPD